MNKEQSPKRFSTAWTCILMIMIIGICIFAGSDTAYAETGIWTDITGTEGFDYPEGIAVDGSGNLYVTDSNHNKIKMLRRGQTVWTDITGSESFSRPFGIAADTSGSVYVTDFTGRTIKKRAAGGTVWTDITYSGGFIEPVDITVDVAGCLYVTDQNTGKVKKLAKGATEWTDISSPGEFIRPFGITVDSSGTVYVTDIHSSKNLVKKLPVNGTWATIPGSFTGPLDVAVDLQGNLFVSNMGSIIKMLEAGSTTWISMSGSGTDLTVETMAVDQSGYLYVAGSWMNKIGKVNPQVSTVTYSAGANGLLSGGTVSASERLCYNAKPGSVPEVVPNPGYALAFWSSDGGSTRLTGAQVSAQAVNGNIDYTAYYKPVAPLSLTASAGKGQVVLNWDNVAGATGYKVFMHGTYGSYAENEFELVYKPAFKARGLTCGAIYYFKVAAYNEYGESGFSPEVSATAGDVWDDITSGAAMDGPWGIALDSSDHVYVTDIYSVDEDTEPVGNILRASVDPVSGNLVWDSESLNGTEDFKSPFGIAVDSHGNVYVTDIEMNKIMKREAGETTWTDINVSGDVGTPAGITVDGSGNVYVTDFMDGSVKMLKYNEQNWTDITFGGAFGGIYSIAADTSDNVYVSCYDDKIRMLANGATAWTDISYSGEFVQPFGIATDSSGNLFVSNITDDRIKILAKGEQNWKGINGFRADSFAYNIAVDSHGNIIGVDINSGKIIRLPVCTATFSAGTNGNISGSVSQRLLCGQNPSSVPSVSPNAGYEFVYWSSDEGGTRLTAAELASEYITEDITYTAYFQVRSSSGSSGGSKPAVISSKSIHPAEGGKVGLNGAATVTIPAGALSGNADVSVSVTKESSSPAIPSGFTLLGSSYEFKVGNHTSYQFNKPVALTFTFDPSKVVNGATPAVHYYDTVSKSWVDLGGKITGNTISVTVDHFTRFAVMAEARQKEDTEWKNPYSDIAEGKWYYDSVSFVSQRGLMNGNAGRFNPNDNMTRAMVITVLHRLAGDTAGYENSFSDVVSSSWYGKAAAWASAKGIAGGVGNNCFAPGNSLSRSQFAVMLYNYAKYKGLNVEFKGGSVLEGYSDAGSIPAWAKDAMEWAVNEGILSGDGANLKPDGNATRAQIAAMLQRFLEKTTD